MDLFASEKEYHGVQFPLPDADIWYHPDFLSSEEASEYFNKLIHETDWIQDDITVFGKTYPQPRLTALYGEHGKSYTYSNITMHPKPFSEGLQNLKTKVETVSGSTFTTVLLNLYRDGKDSNGWHSDDEKELGTDPVIASVSLGAPRMFHLRHRFQKELKQKILLEPGSLLIMKGTTQRYWQHQIPKTKKVIAPRVNLTFRKIS
ncbi:alpha-ketoglutarate-dependent dioxygenase AlkB [uncultured Altibacter sp.]|uniref:alpha-ketoglutarate-dependent dioxygenase AlkB family protein n=1 Tax=uncultured Altibacter sp. TaxID=2506933 RepID=UPI0030D938C8